MKRLRSLRQALTRLYYTARTFRDYSQRLNKWSTIANASTSGPPSKPPSAKSPQASAPPSPQRNAAPWPINSASPIGSPNAETNQQMNNSNLNKRPTASAQEPLFGTWSDVESAVPDTLTPVIVWGILEGEDTPASHEGFRSRTCWRSVRTNEDYGGRLKINIPTHWMPMPDAPTQTLIPL